MRVIHTICFLLCSTFLVGQVNLGASISQRLEQDIIKGEEASYPVYILLQDRIDIPQLAHQLNEQRVPQIQKIQRIVNSLQQKARLTQTSLLERLKREHGLNPPALRSYWVANMLFAELTPAEIQILGADADIAWIDLDTDLKLSSYERETLTTATLEVGGREQGLDAIQAPALWAKGYTGYGGRALVIDTGTDTEHPAINTRFLGNYVPLSEAWFDIEDTAPFDCNDHGTHVCGTIMGLDRLNDDTIGVAFNATWMASPPIACYRRSGFHGTERIIASFQWALNPDDDLSTIDDIPHVINNSWYDNTPDLEECNSAYVDVFNALEAAGVAVVFSAGNEGPGPSTVTPPHNINIDLVNSFTVGALDAAHPNLDIADFSSHGPSICGGQGPELIKPEVSAPGVAVRSCVRNGGYDRFSGTSMASPHVCGAILLLREAFPQLSGRDFKLALYYTAIDLGEPGEDNIYGRGIIDVEAAYQYLIDQGNIPLPVSTTQDVMLIAADLDLQFCNGEAYMEIDVENGGTEILEQFQLVYSITGPVNRMEEMDWTGQLAKGEREHIQLPTFSNLPSGNYTLNVELKSPNQLADERPLDNQFSRNIRIYADQDLMATVQGATNELCISSTVIIQSDYDGPGVVKWYDTEEGGNVLATGSSLVLAPADTLATFYVDVINEWTSGRLDQANAEVAIDATPEGKLIFDCLAPIKLRSVKVYADRFGPRNIVLSNGRGETIAQRLVTLTTVGEHRLTLDFDIPEGENYRLELGGGFSLFHSEGAIGYPYTVPGLLNIKGSDDPDDPENYYYYFYDWEIENSYVCGRSPITVNRSDVGIAPSVEITPSVYTIDLSAGNGSIDFTSDVSSTASNWVWNFGDGNISSEEAPTHQYTAIGEYLVSLTVNAQGMCSNSDTVLIEVNNLTSTSELLAPAFKVQIFPNPTNDRLFVSFSGDLTTEIKWELLDVFGRRVSQNTSRDKSVELNLSNQSAGVYYLKCESNGQKVVKKIILL